MLADDWANQAMDSWPFCEGFENSPVRPFQISYVDGATDFTQRHMDGKTTCRYPDQPILEYYEQWLEAYKERPKFAWIWLNDPAHSSFNEIAWYDDVFLSFFERNREVLSNSFTFVMGDHGYWYDRKSLLSTEIGNMEKSNPYLSISVPSQLRNNTPDILEILKNNAKSLQTHYDTRATILDIVKFQPLTHFKDRNLIEMGNEEKGNSYLRKQPDGPRTCGTLPIPQQYCICQTKSTNVDDQAIRKSKGEKLIEHVNSIIKNEGLSTICETFVFNETTALIHLGTRNATSSYKISVKVKGESHAHFDTLFVYNAKLNAYNFEKVTRLDTYGKTTDCTKDVGFNKLCYCKKSAATSGSTIKSTTGRSISSISTWNPKFTTTTGKPK